MGINFNHNMESFWSYSKNLYTSHKKNNELFQKKKMKEKKNFRKYKTSKCDMILNNWSNMSKQVHLTVILEQSP